MNVQQKCARGVGSVGDVRPAAGQSPDEKTIDRAEGKLALLRKRARVLDIVEQPRDLCSGKIGIEQKSRTFRDHALEALLFELGAQRRGATILPDDRVVDRLARPPIPDQRQFPADWRCRRQPRSEGWLLDLSSASRPVSSTLRQMSSGSCSTHPSRGKIWAKFLLRHRDWRRVGVEDNGARRRRALIDDENASLHEPRSLRDTK